MFKIILNFSVQSVISNEESNVSLHETFDVHAVIPAIPQQVERFEMNKNY